MKTKFVLSEIERRDQETKNMLSFSKFLRKSIFLFILLFGDGCVNKSDNRYVFDIWALNFSKTKTIIFRFTNFSGESYFVSENSWLHNDGDTLYIEAIHKKTKGDSSIFYYEFNPPKLVEIIPGMSVSKKICYKDLKVDIGRIAAIRVYKRQFPFDRHKDYNKYHSEEEFLNYENSSSDLWFVKWEADDELKNW